jgi:hypothetical protein
MYEHLLRFIVVLNFTFKKVFSYSTPWLVVTPEAKCEPPCKHTAIDLEWKIRMIHKYEGGQSLSTIMCELSFAVYWEHRCERCCLHKRTCE